MNLSARSYTKELLDGNNIPFIDIMQNMKELNVINTWLGGHDITIQGLKVLCGNKKSINICEIGCGGGDNLHAIANWGKKNNVTINCTGIDIKEECIDYAKQQWNHAPAKWIVSDYIKAVFEENPDIIFSSLFCHHFTEEELVQQLRWMKANSVKGFFINDLQRHVLAYHSIKLLTKAFSSSYLVKNDAPLSVTRGFKKTEWDNIFAKAGIKHYNIQWKWAFRYLITGMNE